MGKLDIITYYSNSHEVFFNDHFAPSIKLADGHRLIAYKSPQLGDGLFHGNGWVQEVLFKMDILLETLKTKKTFVYADADIRWYGPTSILESYMNDCDIAIQSDGIGGLCTGLMLIANGQKLKPVFEKARKSLIKGTHNCDQPAINDFMKAAKNLKVKVLPEQFWSYGQKSNYEWTGVEPLNIPQGIVTHHANWTRGTENKLKMLREVAKIVAQRPLKGPKPSSNTQVAPY